MWMANARNAGRACVPGGASLRDNSPATGRSFLEKRFAIHATVRSVAWKSWFLAEEQRSPGCPDHVVIRLGFLNRLTTVIREKLCAVLLSGNFLRRAPIPTSTRARQPERIDPSKRCDTLV
jgi:hypothetical protein